MSKHPASYPSALAIVPYVRAYQDQVVSLVLHMQNDEFEVGLSLAEQPDLLTIEAAYAGSGGGFWVAVTVDYQVVGTIGLQVKTGHDGAPWGVMKKFFVLSEYRGRATDGGPGVGARLYDTLLAHARAAGLQGLVLDTPSVAERSHVFYRRAGFQRIAPGELPLEYHYPDRDSLLLRLDLVTLPAS